MKKNIFILFLFSFPLLFSQQIDFNSPQNVKLFADYLFCEKDYLRAIEEFEKYLQSVNNDTIQFKIALSYSIINDQQNAFEKFSQINKSSSFYNLAKFEGLKSLFLMRKDSPFYQTADEIIDSKSEYCINAHKFKNTSLLLSKIDLPVKEEFFIPFEKDDRLILNNFYEKKTNPPYKSPVLAGIFSTLIPGSGKIYTQNISDGIISFLLSGALAYLSYTNFEHKHYTRAWIFTALGAGFYAGNIYGSIASAQIFNAKFNFDFDEGVKMYLQEKNYFLPVYEFCK